MNAWKSDEQVDPVGTPEERAPRAPPLEAYHLARTSRAGELRFAGEPHALAGPARRAHADRVPLADGDLARLDRREQRLDALERRLAMDPKTVQLLSVALTALDEGRPLLLVGDPACGKTMAAMLAALKVGRDPVRINLSENVREDQLFGGLQPGTSAERPLEWVAGPATQAFRSGQTLVIDEVNLAPSSVLDRALSMVEDPPYLSLLEQDGREVALHSEFRVIATMNPEDHVGRRPLSSAFRDRFVEYVVDPPDHESFVAAAAHWIDGAAASEIDPSSADFDLGGPYSLRVRPRAERLCPALAAVPALREPIGLVTRVVATLAEQFRSGALGADRAGGSSFGRRHFSRFLEALDVQVKLAQQRRERDLRPRFLRTLQRHFLAPFGSADRDAVRHLLFAEGLLDASTPLWHRRTLREGP